MKDKLESYFKKQLNKDQPTQEDWNNLSDSVWDYAMSELDKPKSDRKLFFLLSTVGFLIIVIGVSFYFLNQLNKEVKANKNSALVAQVISGNKQVKIIPNDKTKQEIIFDLQNKINNNQGKQNINKTKTIKNNNILYSHSPKIISNKKQDLEFSIMDNNEVEKNDGLIKSNHHFSTYKISKKKTPILIAALPSILVQSLSSKNTILLIDTIISNDENKVNIMAQYSSSPKYEISAYYGLSLTSTPMSDVPKQSILKGYQKLQISSSFGLEFGYNINSTLQIRSGLSIFNVKSWSYSHHQLEYNSTNEFLDNGFTYNNLELSMPTPIGEIETNLLFRKSSSNTLQDGDQYLAKFDVHQNYQLISLPLGLNYKLYLTGKHAINIGAGMSWFIVLKNSDNFDVELIKLADNSAMQLMKKSIKPHSSVKNNFLAYYAQIGYSYTLNNKISININAHYFNNISNFSNIKNVNTNVHGITLKSGVSIRF